MLHPRRTARWRLAGGWLGAALLGMACGDGSDVPEMEPLAGASGTAGLRGVAAAGGSEDVAAAGGSEDVAEPPFGGDSGAGGAGAESNAGAGGQASALPPIEYCDAPTKVLTASCGNGSCHSNPGATIGDFAVGPVEAASFVDVVSVRDASCGRIIDSRDYSKSLLLTKITGGFPAPNCGGRMPIGSFIITEEQTECLASWLQQFQR
ncbi:MAG TPA: hypothetical protein VJU61_22380 [Polyangiaceae bacterium]|nr:hypothetical protein [Polyangiaceae bacterium]